jgi:hypothetical protein
MENDNDYVIHRICAREQRKYPRPHGLSLSEQLRCLMALAVKRRGIATRSAMKELLEHALGRTTDMVEVVAFCAHPLLRADDDSIVFKYDVIREHFMNIFISHLFIDSEPVTAEIVALLAERNRFARDFVRWSVERIAATPEELSLRALSIIEGVNSLREEISRLECGRAQTTVLLIVLHAKGLAGAIDRGKATAVLVDLFGDGGKISGASLIDVTEPLAFDFRGMEIQDSSFMNYDDFWECEFSEQTRFANCVLSNLPKKESYTTTAKRVNFDMNTCAVDDTVVSALASQREKVASARKQKYDDLSKFLRYFYKNGRLYPQREIVLRRRYHGSWDIQVMIKQLKAARLIVDHKNEQKKTLGAELAISKQFQPDVVKFIHEDNVTDKLRTIIQELTLQ